MLGGQATPRYPTEGPPTPDLTERSLSAGKSSGKGTLLCERSVEASWRTCAMEAVVRTSYPLSTSLPYVYRRSTVTLHFPDQHQSPELVKALAGVKLLICLY